RFGWRPHRTGDAAGAEHSDATDARHRRRCLLALHDRLDHRWVPRAGGRTVPGPEPDVPGGRVVRRSRTGAVVPRRVVAHSSLAVLAARSLVAGGRRAARTVAIRHDRDGGSMSEQTAQAPAPLGLLKTIIVGAAGLFYAYGVW